LGCLDPGGVETWLLHVLRSIDRERYRFDFLLHRDKPSAYDAEVVRLGARLHYCTTPRNPIRYALDFRRVLARYGPYDIVHSHVHHHSGYVLKLADSCGVAGRVAHSHSDTLGIDTASGLVRAAYLRQCKRWISAHATDRIAASVPAGEALFQEGNSEKPRFTVLYCGVDLSRFQRPCARQAIRRSLGIPARDLVLGHVGRFDQVKNHPFLLETAKKVISRRADTWLLLVGDGPLREKICAQAKDLGISGRVIFTGARADVPELLAAMDVFLFPSHYEGLPLALVEAQVAGLPVVTSTKIPREAFWRPELVTLAQFGSHAEWASATLASSTHRSSASISDCPFDIAKSVLSLCQLYSSRILALSRETLVSASV
jgi:glycosyltransferase involved in cell wall biosynthesis